MTLSTGRIGRQYAAPDHPEPAEDHDPVRWLVLLARRHMLNFINDVERHYGLTSERHRARD